MWVRLQPVCLPVCLHTSLCGFYHNRDAAVCCDGLGPPAANHIQTHFITPTPSPYALVTNHPESLSMWHAAHIRSKATLQKMGHIDALPWLLNLIGMHTRKDTQLNNVAKFMMLILTRKEHGHTNLSLTTPVLLTQNPLMHFCFDSEKTLGPTIMQRMITKIQQRGERSTSIVSIQSYLSNHVFHFFSFSWAKRLCASKECEHRASVEIAKTTED